ncbi:MAG: CoA-binding protein [Planctomycetota bacterium]
MEQEKTRVAIVGASPDRTKYGNKALRGFAAAGYEVYPINPNYDEIEGFKCYRNLDELPIRPDIITLYTPPPITEKLVSGLGKYGASEIYFNPGTENDRVKELAEEQGLPAIFACSVMARAFFTD